VRQKFTAGLACWIAIDHPPDGSGFERIVAPAVKLTSRLMPGTSELSVTPAGAKITSPVTHIVARGTRSKFVIPAWSHGRVRHRYRKIRRPANLATRILCGGPTRLSATRPHVHINPGLNRFRCVHNTATLSVISRMHQSRGSSAIMFVARAFKTHTP
jgi:hypothetical protein